MIRHNGQVQRIRIIDPYLGTTNPTRHKREPTEHSRKIAAQYEAYLVDVEAVEKGKRFDLSNQLVQELIIDLRNRGKASVHNLARNIHTTPEAVERIVKLLLRERRIVLTKTKRGTIILELR